LRTDPAGKRTSRSRSLPLMMNIRGDRPL